MEDVLKHLVDAPIANLFVLAGLFFLGIGIVGNISGKIAPGTAGRIGGAILGSVLLIAGIVMHSRSPHESAALPESSDNTTSLEKKNSGSSGGDAAKSGPAPQSFRVVETFLRADPLEHTGPCPITIKFSGRISVAGGSGTISYKFLRSHGASAPVETLAFPSSGSKEVSTTWTLGGSGLPSYRGWQAIQIFEPQEMRSSERKLKTARTFR